MDRIYMNDGIMRGFTYDDAVLILRNCNPERGSQWEQMKKEIRQWAFEGITEMMNDLEEHKNELWAAAFPDEKSNLENDPEYPPEKADEIVNEIVSFLKKWNADLDVCIYYNGKRLNVHSGVIEEDMDPRDYFNYVANPHILSMSFEGTMYEYMNCCRSWGTEFVNEFEKILARFGLFEEMGDAWNLSCYKR